MVASCKHKVCPQAKAPESYQVGDDGSGCLIVGQVTILKIATHVTLRYRSCYRDDVRAAAVLAMLQCNLQGATNPIGLLTTCARKAAAREVAALRGLQRTRKGYVVREVRVRRTPSSPQELHDSRTAAARTQHDPTLHVHEGILLGQLRSRLMGLLPGLRPAHAVALTGALAGYTQAVMGHDLGVSEVTAGKFLLGAIAQVTQ